MQIRTYNAVSSAQGIDVSNWQGRFDWAGTSGLSFGIYRLTQGLGGPGTGSPDPDAGWNHAQIRDKGLHPGAYHFLDPKQDGAAQARYFVDEYGKLGLIDTDMLWLDNETAGDSVQQVADCANAFMNELHSLRPSNPMGVYTFIDFAKAGNCAGLEHWPLWLAYPNLSAPAAPPPWAKWTFWQWGTRPEGGQSVDADAFNGTGDDLLTWIASFHVVPGINPVRNLHRIRRGWTSVTLAWDAPPGATSYTVKAYEEPDSINKLVEEVDVLTPVARVGNLQRGTTYRFRVEARPDRGGSDAAINVTTR